MALDAIPGSVIMIVTRGGRTARHHDVPTKTRPCRLREFVRAQRQLAHVSLRNLAKMSGSSIPTEPIERELSASPQVVKCAGTAFGLKPEQLYTMLGFI
jgi:hypothetical protein